MIKIDYYELSERLKTLRHDRGITQDVLSKYLSTTKSTISKYENGLSVPSYEVLISYARYFKVSTDYLLGVQKEMRVDVSGLTESQIRSIEVIINEYHRANNTTR